ncbi:MAG: electron transfer flavoprotein subunit alpha/FixB family protein [Dethiobacter sp.]|jgi:electron transfer flavoprotein alpha subunit|nr:MAG: electron transfer flavoprotein subunit alpha/FixB family protein [Dethiobacter sp.]
MSEYQRVLIYGEILEGKLASITKELLGIGRKLADELGQMLYAVIIGSGIPAELAQECVYFGADKVYVIDDPLFKDYLTDSYTAAMEKLTRDLKPDIVLFGQTSMGRDLAPRLAYRLNTGVTLDCIELVIDSETKLMYQTKPVYGGKAYAIYVCQTKPQIVSIRPKTMSPIERDTSRKGEVITFALNINATAIGGKVVERIKEEITRIKLEDADVVVCGGRGVGEDGFQLLEELALSLNGVVGATRPPCDNGWVQAQYQIGLTGKVVAPRLYIGVALSGASQHLSGMMGSKNIVAINTDPEASIFRAAHYGVVGNYRKVISAFIEKCKEEVTS